MDLDCGHDDYNADCLKCNLRFANQITETESDNSQKSDSEVETNND